MTHLKAKERVIAPYKHSATSDLRHSRIGASGILVSISASGLHPSSLYTAPMISIADGLGAFNILQARGVDSQFLTFPDENHWVLKPENSLAWHKVVINWINKYAGLPPFTTQDPDSDEFWGGTRDAKEEVTEMVSQGKPEM